MSEKYGQFVRMVMGVPHFVIPRDFSGEEVPPAEYAVWIHLPYTPERNGVPSVAEHKMINKADDQIHAQMKPFGAVSAGRVTGGGASRILFYLASPEVPKLTRKTGMFRSEEVAAQVIHDPDWVQYQEWMVPTPMERMLMHDFMLHQQLDQHGNQPERIRPVDFTVVVPRAASEEFYRRAFALGYRMPDASVPGAIPEKGMFTVTRDSSTIPEEVAALALEVEALAIELGGNFDGWACPVEKLEPI